MICCVIFGLFSGQPLVLLGSTGPVYVFEKILYQVWKNLEILIFQLWESFLRHWLDVQRPELGLSITPTLDRSLGSGHLTFTSCNRCLSLCMLHHKVRKQKYYNVMFLEHSRFGAEFHNYITPQIYRRTFCDSGGFHLHF